MTVTYSPPTTPTSDRQPTRSRASRYLAAGGVILLGLVVAVGWFAYGVMSAANAPDDFARGNLPADVTVQVTDTGTQYVYYEGARTLLSMSCRSRSPTRTAPRFRSRRTP